MKKFIFIILLCFITGAGFSQSPFCGVDSIYNLPSTSGRKMFRDAALKEILKWRDLHKGDFNRYTAPSGTMGFSSSGCEQTTFYIPVAVHIIHLPDDSIAGMGTNISDAQVQNAIELLNRGFANSNNHGSPAVNTGIKFCLATRKPDGSKFNGIFRFGSVQSNHIIDSIGRLSNLLITGH